MNTAFNLKPLYMQVLEALTQRVVAGEWKPGMLIKNEVDLSREYGVSVGTMRKALTELERSRVITRKQGRGSYVSEQLESDYHARYDNIRDIAHRGVADRVTSTSIENVFADDVARQQLRLRSGARVFMCRQIRRDGTKPTAFDEAIVPAELFPDLNGAASYDLALASKRNGQMLGEAVEKVFLQPPSKLAAEVLGLQHPAKVAVFDRLICNISEQPVEWRRVWTELEDRYYLARIA